MTTFMVLLSLVAITSAAFAWLASSLLAALSWPMVQIGSALHKTMKGAEHTDADVWLFVLLLRVTRPIVIGLATVVFASTLGAALLPVTELFQQFQAALLNLFSIFLIMRMLCVAYGVQSVLKTLKG
jgi:hypothetical protein